MLVWFESPQTKCFEKLSRSKTYVVSWQRWSELQVVLWLIVRTGKLGRGGSHHEALLRTQSDENERKKGLFGREKVALHSLLKSSWDQSKDLTPSFCFSFGCDTWRHKVCHSKAGAGHSWTLTKSNTSSRLLYCAFKETCLFCGAHCHSIRCRKS